MKEGLRQIFNNFNKYYEILDWLIICYGILVASVYLILCVLSVLELRLYYKKRSFTNYDHILSSPLAPAISIIAPAYNEQHSVVENIRSMLTLRYPNYEIIIVNDGSSDDTFKLIKEAYDIEKIEYYYNEQIKTEKVRGIYKSKNPAFKNLIIIDKENGGKADALNVGLNYSNSKYVSCVDVDSLLHPEALERLIKPFLERNNHKVLAAGGVIRVANACEIKKGNLVKVGLSRNLLVQFQVIEYLRAFLLGRMAWTRCNGLLLVSGAFGLFNRDLAIKSGGYSIDTVGEDMELVMRMREYAHKTIGENYKTVYIPDPLCWTEVPEKIKSFVGQRDRWTRGGIESLWRHRNMFFNLKYGWSGMLAYLYFVFIEWAAPIVEFLGFIYFFLLIYFDIIDWSWFLSLFAVVYCFMIMYSCLAILIEELTFHGYPSKKEIIKLIAVSFLEPFIYHPFQSFIAIKGNLHLIFQGNNNDWGEMEHDGFQTEDDKEREQNVKNKKKS